jgi:maleylpyruvate isomerase
MNPLKLYHYWRSSSSWRVRWVFALKKIQHELQAIDLLSGESESPEHLIRHPAGFVPVLEFVSESDPKKKYLRESIAICEWANEMFPLNPIFPADPFLRAQTRSLVEIINAGTQPLQNLPVQYYYSDDLEKRKLWAQHWIQEGLSVYEKSVTATVGKFSVGDQITLADIFLVPQIYNAIRFDVDYNQFKQISKIYQNALTTPEYAASEPSRFQP